MVLPNTEDRVRAQPRLQAIDIVCDFEFADASIARPDWSKRFITDKAGGDPAIFDDMTPEAYIEKMDLAGVEHTLIVATRAGSADHRIHRHIPYEKVADIVERFPTRFSGLAGVDPTAGMRGLRELERAVRNLGFVGAHLYPHWFEMAPDHAKYYPIYAKCAELGIPIQVQVGHCLRYSDDRPLRSVGRPITLDTIACDFPELKLIGIHIGWPWTEEMISVSYKHPNVYIGSDAHAPRYWPPSFVHYINTWGKNKVLFGTDFPVIEPGRALQEIAELSLREESKQRLLWDNAMELYGLRDRLSGR